jgi:hypothetical protein
MARRNGLEYVLQRNKQYFKHFKVNYVLCCFLIVVNFLLFFLLYNQWNPTVAPKYIVASPLGNVLWSCPMNVAPNSNSQASWQKTYCSSQLSDQEVKDFARKACLKVWSLDYSNYKMQLADASQYFSKKGWQNFIVSLKASNDLKLLTGDRGDLKSKIFKPVINESGITIVRKLTGVYSNSGRYSWMVRMPINIPQMSYSQYVEVLVQREPVANFPNRLAIVQYRG